MLLAETIDAEDARALSLVTWVVPAGRSTPSPAISQGGTYGPPVALAQSKALLNDDAGVRFRGALANKARTQPVNFATANALEAYAAFAAKREPSFTGRWAVPRLERKDAPRD